MFFLLRACLWIGAVILLVPMLPAMHDDGAPSSARPAAAPPAAAAVAGPQLPGATDVVRYCLENGAVCEAGFSVVAALGDAVGHGLQFAATLQHGDAAAPAPAAATYDPPPLAVATTAVRVSPLPPATGGTLTAADRAEPWLAETAQAALPAALPTAGPVPPLPAPDPRRRPAG